MKPSSLEDVELIVSLSIDFVERASVKMFI